MTTTHQQIKSWIATFWRHGAVDVNGRDELTHMLDTERAEYRAIVAEMRKFARYLPARSFTRWQAWQEGK